VDLVISWAVWNVKRKLSDTSVASSNQSSSAAIAQRTSTINKFNGCCREFCHHYMSPGTPWPAAAAGGGGAGVWCGRERVTEMWMWDVTRDYARPTRDAPWRPSSLIVWHLYQTQIQRQQALCQLCCLHGTRTREGTLETDGRTYKQNFAHCTENYRKIMQILRSVNTVV